MCGIPEREKYKIKLKRLNQDQGPEILLYCEWGPMKVFGGNTVTKSYPVTYSTKI